MFMCSVVYVAILPHNPEHRMTKVKYIKVQMTLEVGNVPGAPACHHQTLRLGRRFYSETNMYAQAARLPPRVSWHAQQTFCREKKLKK